MKKSRIKSYLALFTGLLCALSLVTGPDSCRADLPPSIVDIVHPNGQKTYIRDVNDSGQVVGFTQAPFPSMARTPFRWENGTFQNLNPLVGSTDAEANAINNSGAVVGSSTFPVNSTIYKSGTMWSAGSSSAVDLKTGNAPAIHGSEALDINDSGIVVGVTAHCAPSITGTGCSGGFPGRGNPFLAIAPAESQLVRSGTLFGGVLLSINANGDAVGNFMLQLSLGDGALFPAAGGIVPVGINPQVVLLDGTVIGENYGGGGVRVRPPGGGPPQAINCGAFVADANEAGDILTYDIRFDGFKIWHGGTCYPVSSLLPDGVSGYTFPSTSISQGSLNKFGQIALEATKSGVLNNIGVLLTPKYPFAIEVIATPTGTIGEYDFEAVVKRGAPVGTVSWDFGDGNAPIATGLKTRKKFTKPGTFLVKAVTQDSAGVKTTSTYSITVAPPTLNLGIVIPAYPTGEVPMGAEFKIEVNVSAAADGVGDLNDLAFQAGTFTASAGDILAYTTANTSPFSLSPGKGNSYPLAVKASAVGEVTLDSIIIGKDAIGRAVSAHATKKITIGGPADPTAELSGKIKALQDIIKKLKGKFPVKQKKAQADIKSQLKSLAADLAAFAKSKKSEIKITSVKLNVTKLASGVKSAVGKAIQRKSSFAADKKAASKSLAALLKALPKS